MGDKACVTVSCPRFCARLMPEIYHTEYLWTPLCPSESTHPPTTFSEDFSKFSEWLTPNSELTNLLPSLALRLTPHSDSVHQLQSALSFSRRCLWSTTPVLWATTSPSFRSWLPSFGSCFSHASWVWKCRLGLLYVVRHEVIGFFHPTLLLLLVVEFWTHFYSLFHLLWLCSYRQISIYTRLLYTL